MYASNQTKLLILFRILTHARHIVQVTPRLKDNYSFLMVLEGGLFQLYGESGTDVGGEEELMVLR